MHPPFDTANAFGFSVPVCPPRGIPRVLMLETVNPGDDDEDEDDDEGGKGGGNIDPDEDEGYDEDDEDEDDEDPLWAERRAPGRCCAAPSDEAPVRSPPRTRHTARPM